MINVTLDRIGEHDGQTYGVLRVANRPRFVTIEDAWRDNKPDVSCIPVGVYRCAYYSSPKFGWTYLVDGVPGRSGILIHPGNSHEDTRGCILVGSSFSPDAGSSGIIHSRTAFGLFLRLLKDEKYFELLVRDLIKDTLCSQGSTE